MQTVTFVCAQTGIRLGRTQAFAPRARGHTDRRGTDGLVHIASRRAPDPAPVRCDDLPHTRRAALGRLGVLKGAVHNDYAHGASPRGCEVANRTTTGWAYASR